MSGVSARMFGGCDEETAAVELFQLGRATANGHTTASQRRSSVCDTFHGAAAAAAADDVIDNI